MLKLPSLKHTWKGSNDSADIILPLHDGQESMLSSIGLANICHNGPQYNRISCIHVFYKNCTDEDTHLIYSYNLKGY